MTEDDGRDARYLALSATIGQLPVAVHSCSRSVTMGKHVYFIHSLVICLLFGSLQPAAGFILPSNASGDGTGLTGDATGGWSVETATADDGIVLAEALTLDPNIQLPSLGDAVELVSEDGNFTDTSIEEEEGESSRENETESGEEVLRYAVAAINWDYVSTPYIVCLWIIFASIAKIGFHYHKKLSSIFPESCLLIILGIVTGLVLYYSHITHYQMSSKIFFLFLLPPIILDAGYFMDNRSFFDNLGTILLFAVIGTLFNTILIGVSLWGLSEDNLGWINVQIPLTHCLVFSALISAVDPVAVLAVFEEVHVQEMLHIVVFGESLLNDAVTVVLYHMLETFSEIERSGTVTYVDILSGIASFFVVALGGVGIGIVVALIASFITRWTSHVRVIEPLIVIIFGYISYLTAEIFELSGIMACTFCGITMRKYVESNISKKSHTTIKYFLKMMASICETIIFMLLGVSTVADTHEWNTAFVLLTVVFCLVYRSAGVIILTYFANIFRANKLTKVDQFVMAYGGLRGAIAFSLVVLLEYELFPRRNLLFTSTIVVIFFTVFVLGTTIKPLVNILNVKRSNKHKPTMNEQIHSRLVDHLMAGIEDIAGHFGHHEIREKFQRLNTKYLKPILVRPSSQKMRGISILNVYNKLTEKDAQDYLATHGSFANVQNNLSTATSLYKYFRSQSTASLDARKNSVNEFRGIPLTESSATCLDMGVLNIEDSHQLEQDTEWHHILDESMFQTRKTFNRHQRHMLPEVESRNQLPVFHHKARLHLRHLLGGGARMNHHHRKHGSANNGLYHNSSKQNMKEKKLVSFANPAMTGTDDELPLKKDSLVNGETPIINGEEPVAKQEKDNGSETSSDDGIFFSANKTDDDTSKPQNEEDEDKKKEDEDEEEVTSPCTAVELTLPWKRQTGRQPISSTMSCSLPDDNRPQIGEVPSWVDNLDYTEASPPIPSPSSPKASSHISATNGAHSHSGDDDVDNKSKMEENEAPVVLPPPWKRGSGDERVIDCDEKTKENESEKLKVDVKAANAFRSKEDNCDSSLPPWRALGASSGPVRSPSFSREGSILQQESHKSLRLSEAESHHSEPFRKHSLVIDLINGVNLHDDDFLTEAVVDVDTEENDMNCEDRVATWLMANSSELLQPPEDPDPERDHIEVHDTYL